MPKQINHLPVKAATRGPRHHFFGYYDKDQWDPSGRYILALETRFADRPPGPDDYATVGLIDLEKPDKFEPLARTRAWNWQQGAMLQWLPGTSERLVIYNDRIEETFVSIILDIDRGKRRELPRPIYALSRDGKLALSLNFSRVHRLRPGYGYAGIPDPGERKNHPDDDGIFLMDLETGESRLIISLQQIASLEPDETMKGFGHWFNHLLFNTDSSRFIFLHRWQKPDGWWWTRMFTANRDGSDIYCVASDGMVSHFDWKDSKYILAWARRHPIGDRYFLFEDRSRNAEVVGEGILTTDGHCTFSPDRNWILTDTSPEKDMRALLLYRPADDLLVEIGRFYSPEHLQGEIRCDLHPRWSRDGKEVCIDSAHEGARQIYLFDVSRIVGEK